MSQTHKHYVRKGLAVASIIIGGTAVAVSNPEISKILMALATAMNAASLYLLKEEPANASATGSEGTQTSPSPA